MISQLNAIRIQSAYYGISWAYWCNKITFEQFIRFRNRLTRFLNSHPEKPLVIKQLKKKSLIGLS